MSRRDVSAAGEMRKTAIPIGLLLSFWTRLCVLTQGQLGSRSYPSLIPHNIISSQPAQDPSRAPPTYLYLPLERFIGPEFRQCCRVRAGSSQPFGPKRRVT